MGVSRANAAPWAVWAPKAALFGRISVPRDIDYGLSEALWTLAISLECLKVAVLCIESRYLVCTLSLGIRLKTRQGGPELYASPGPCQWARRSPA